MEGKFAYCHEEGTGTELHDAAFEKLQDLKYELENHNRFFPRQQYCIDIELEKIKSFSVANSLDGQMLCRARLIDIELQKKMSPISRNAEKKQFFGLDESEYLAPPKEKTVEGRCNPKGISYLYTSLDDVTAIHEIKPSIGDRVAVAKLSCSKPKNLFGVGMPAIFTSSFAMLDAIATVFSSPFTLDKSYILTQYLSEKVKSMGFEGLYLKSSVHSGYNIILFQDNVENRCRVTNVALYEIKSLQYNFSQYELS